MLENKNIPPQTFEVRGCRVFLDVAGTRIEAPSQEHADVVSQYLVDEGFVDSLTGDPLDDSEGEEWKN